jgi:hypothetical protein
MKSVLPKALRRTGARPLSLSSMEAADVERRFCPVIGSAKPGYLPERRCARRRGHSGEHDWTKR